MKQICKYNPDRDIAPHRPNMSLDLDKVFEDFTIPVGGSSSVEFPDVSDTDMIGDRVRDVFDVIENQNALLQSAVDKQTYSSGASQTTVNTVIESTPTEGGAA